MTVTLLLMLASLLAAPAPQKPAASSAATGAKGPRQEAIDWFTSTADDATGHVVASAREQIAAFRKNVPDQADMAQVLSGIIGPGAMFRAQGAKLTVTGQPQSVITIESGGSPPLQITFEPESVSGDRALVPLGLTSGTMTARGSIELTREGGAWRVAAADLGPQARWPRFDSPSFVPDMVKMLQDSQRQRRAAVLAVQARSAVAVVQSAEEAFQTANGGFYGPLECLSAPKGCLPSYGDGAAPLREPPALEGYTPAFVAGPAPTAAEISRARASKRSLKSWAFTMTPAASDMPGFCSDSTGKVCQMAPGTSVSAPACPATCGAIK